MNISFCLVFEKSHMYHVSSNINYGRLLGLIPISHHSLRSWFQRLPASARHLEVAMVWGGMWTSGSNTEVAHCMPHYMCMEVCLCAHLCILMSNTYEQRWYTFLVIYVHVYRCDPIFWCIVYAGVSAFAVIETLAMVWNRVSSLGFLAPWSFNCMVSIVSWCILRRFEDPNVFGES